MWTWISNPTVISALVAGAVVLMTKLWDRVVARGGRTDAIRHADHELLSKDEQVFRTTIIQQLQMCHDSMKLLVAEKVELEKANVMLTARATLLEAKLEIANLRGQN